MPDLEPRRRVVRRLGDGRPVDLARVGGLDQSEGREGVRDGLAPGAQVRRSASVALWKIVLRVTVGMGYSVGIQRSATVTAPPAGEVDVIE